MALRHIVKSSLPCKLVVRNNIARQPSRTFTNVHQAHSRWKSGGIAASVGVVSVTLLHYASQHAQEAHEEEPKSSEETSKTKNNQLPRSVQDKCDEVIERVRIETGCPGIVAAVSVNGVNVWTKAAGYSDIENGVSCSEHTVMRIASISKPITMAIIARLKQQHKLNLDTPISDYLPSWPTKSYDGQDVNITTRQLVSHLSGIRHYDKTCQLHRDQHNKRENAKKSSILPKTIDTNCEPVTEKEDKNIITKPEEGKKDKEKEGAGDNAYHEFYLTKHYSSVQKALDLFQNDLLCSNPGSEFLYSSHAFTVISAVAEATSGRNFPTLLRELCSDLGMQHTVLDENDKLIYNRSRFYVKNKNGRIVNAPYVDLSSKWAGGGMMSTVGDLLLFANAMLYSYQYDDCHAVHATHKAGYINTSVMKEVWTPVLESKVNDSYYGMGWFVTPEKCQHGGIPAKPLHVEHTGGAMGASSVLLVLPTNPQDTRDSASNIPSGISVAIMTNLPSIGLSRQALEIAKLFREAETS